MVGIGLGDLSEEELSDETKSGLFGFFGLVGTGVSLLKVSKEGNEEGTLVDFPFSFGVLSLLFWTGVNLDSSLSDLSWGVGTGGVFGGVFGG